MSVNMSSLWELIREVTNHTTELLDLVILGIILICAYTIGSFVADILYKGTKYERKK